jgi:hypothetical protein
VEEQGKRDHSKEDIRHRSGNRDHGGSDTPPVAMRWR